VKPVCKQGEFEMAKTSQLVNLTPDQLREIPGFKTQKPIEVAFAKRAVAAADAKGALKKWMDSVPEPKVDQPAPKAINAVKLTAEHVTKLRAVNESTAPTAEIINQEMSPDDLLGVSYSAFVILDYIKLGAEFKSRLSNAKDKAALNEKWQDVVKGARDALAAAGLKNLTEADLENMAAELKRNTKNFNAVTTIANTAVDVPGAAAKKLGTGNFVTQTGVQPSAAVAVVTAKLGTLTKGICSQPLAQGSYTKHLSQTFSLQVTINIWCPTWTNPFRTCPHTYTLASLMYAVDLNVGYVVNCCGASAWGQAGAQVCGSIVGVTLCANCTASVTLVAGLTKNPSGSNCIYGLGVVAELKCKVGSVTVLDYHVPYGWTITAPCPPPGIC
jgi:hypothetical protein